MKRRNCWPKPFNCPDRFAVRAPFAVMVANGWERQNLLGEHHFEAQNGQLTDAGKLKVRWIVTEAPEQHRTIYVHQAATPQETAARVAAVEQAASQLDDQRGTPPVLETSISESGWSAERVDAIGRKFQASTPEPRLPAAQVEGE